MYRSKRHRVVESATHTHTKKQETATTQQHRKQTQTVEHQHNEKPKPSQQPTQTKPNQPRTHNARPGIHICQLLLATIRNLKSSLQRPIMQTKVRNTSCKIECMSRSLLRGKRRRRALALRRSARHHGCESPVCLNQKLQKKISSASEGQAEYRKSLQEMTLVDSFILVNTS